FAKATFHIPSIHCVSCIWLLENLYKVDNGIIRSEVNFVQKKATIGFNPETIRLSSVARLLTSLGYMPAINLDSEAPAEAHTDRSLVLKMAVAGFSFGNVMLVSFPEFLGIDHSERSLIRLFSWLNLAL